MLVSIALLLCLLMACVSYFPTKVATKITELFRSYNLKNVLLRFVYEAYFEILIGVFVNAYYLKFSDTFDWLNSISTIILAIFAFNLPLFVYHKVVASVLPWHLNFSLYRKAYGSIYEGLRINDRQALAVCVMFLFQRLIFVIACVMLRNHPLG